MSKKECFNEFASIITNSDQKILKALKGGIPTKDVNTLSEALIKVFEFHGKTFSLIEPLIISEFNETVSAGTLFRTNSLASKCMTIWSRMSEGMAYLQKTIRKPVAEICSGKYGSLEINPEFARPEDNTVENVTVLASIIQDVLDSITGSLDVCPTSFRVVCSYLYKYCDAKFPSQTIQIIGGFIVLRFFCAALVTPESNGLVEESPSLDSRRILILVSKTIQNLSNHASFRETFMDALNNFLDTNQHKMDYFLEQVSKVPEDKAADAAAAVAAAEQGKAKSSNVSVADYEAALATLAELCSRNMFPIESSLPDPDPASKKHFMEDLKKIINQVKAASSTGAAGSVISSAGMPQGSASPQPAHHGAAGLGSGHGDSSKSREKEEKKKQKTLDKKQKELEKLSSKAKSKKGAEKEAEEARRRDLRAQVEAMIGEKLTSAVDAGNVQIIEETLAEDKGMVNATDSEGQTALHHACASGNLGIVKLLLKSKADCYLQDKSGWTALHVAAFHNHEDVLLELCKQRHIDFSAMNDDENTPLHYFARAPYTKNKDVILKAFLAGGADINAQNTILETPLHMAVWKQNAGMITLLLENGADPKMPNSKGDTPYDWLALIQNPELTAVFENALKERALNTNSHKKANAQLDSAAFRTQYFLDAVRADQVDKIKEVLKIEKKLSDTAFGQSKNTALHIAAVHGNLESTKILLKYTTRMVRNGAGWTPLMASLWQGHVNVALTILLSRHAIDPNQKLEDGNTALHMACFRPGELTEFIIFSLLERGADINAPNLAGDTPLHAAVRGGNVRIAQVLLENGASKQKVNKDHELPITIAQKRNLIPMITLLDDKPEGPTVDLFKDTTTVQAIPVSEDSKTRILKKQEQYMEVEKGLSDSRIEQ